MQLLFLMIALGAVLYASGWLGKLNVLSLQQRIYKSVGAVFVFGVALLLTRNLGAAAVSMMVFSLLMNSGKLSSSNPRAHGPKGMTVDEAYQLFGLRPGATPGDVQAAYRRIMKLNHPDQGGSTYIAAKINEAKHVLLAAMQSA